MGKAAIAPIRNTNPDETIPEYTQNVLHATSVALQRVGINVDLKVMDSDKDNLAIKAIRNSVVVD